MELSDKKGFTIIEILTVLFLILILSNILFFLFNYLDIIKRARDSRRLNDLKVLDSAIKNLLLQNPSWFSGQDYVIYISLPDNNSNCSSYSNLPPIFSPFSYRCSNSSNYLKTDGSGWLPINFSSSLIGVSKLPVDPLNNSEYFYAFLKIKNKYKLTAKMESEAFGYEMINDGGIEPLLYEIGNDLKIPSPQSGLIIYLPFEEGEGTITKDLSGYNNNGTLYNFDFTTSSGWVKGKIGWGLAFDGINDYVYVPNSYSLQQIGNLTIFFYAYPTNISKGRQNPLGKAYGGEFDLTMETNGSLSYYHGTSGSNSSPYMSCNSTGFFQNSSWVNVIIKRNITKQEIQFYKNGIPNNSSCTSWLNPSQSNNRLGIGYEYAGYFQGILDEVRIYSKSLSKEDIKILTRAY